MPRKARLGKTAGATLNIIFLNIRINFAFPDLFIKIYGERQFQPPKQQKNVRNLTQYDTGSRFAQKTVIVFTFLQRSSYIYA